ncbi:MAG: hypothetical protein WB630_14580, partial [Candidatus Acidiferrales bacterium]
MELTERVAQRAFEAKPAPQALVAFAVGVNATLKAQLAPAARDAAHDALESMKSDALPPVKLGVMFVMALAVLLLSSNASVGLVPPISWSQNTVLPPV